MRGGKGRCECEVGLNGGPSSPACADDRVNFKVYREDISDVAVSVTNPLRGELRTHSHSLVPFHSILIPIL